MGLINPNHNNMVNVRKRLLAERGSVCEKCGYRGYVEAHHIKQVVEGGLDHNENVVLLCEKCHADAHGYKKKKYIDKAREFWSPTKGVFYGG